MYVTAMTQFEYLETKKNPDFINYIVSEGQDIKCPKPSNHILIFINL